MPGRTSDALLVDWSPKRVRVSDPVAQRIASGDSLAACLGGLGERREAIFAVNQRSAFVRSLYVPKVGATETDRIIANQVAQIFPFPASECVFGYRLGAESAGKGRIAVVGAVRAATLRKLYEEAAAVGIKVRAVVPLAFGTWLAVREQGLADCLAVEETEDTLSLDLIAGGELAYSRSIPKLTSPDELSRELDRTFQIAERPPAPIVASESLNLERASPLRLDGLSQLGRPNVVSAQLFSLSLPESIEAERASRSRGQVTRALTTAAAAAALGVYAVWTHLPSPTAVTPGSSTALRKAKSKESAAKAALAKLEETSRLLDVAFSPGQSMSDAITVLSQAASANSWFTSLSISRGAPMSISGIALSDDDVAKLSAKVAKDARFEETKVVSLSKTTVGKRPVSQFMVLGKLRGFLAFDRPMRGKKK